MTRLKRCADAIKARGATSLYLFGSAARDEAEAAAAAQQAEGAAPKE